ncbi:MAG: hypothetical protein ACI8PZ_001367 [Myxococcota bacterium]|jgi:hypothetical protein
MTDHGVSMLILLCLFACAPSPSSQDDAIRELRAESAAMWREVAALGTDVEVMRERVAALEARPRPAPAPKESGPVCTERTDGGYTVPRGLDTETLSTEARAMLHRDAGGQYDGYRLSAIRRVGTSSTPAASGMATSCRPSTAAPWSRRRRLSRPSLTISTAASSG